MTLKKQTSCHTFSVQDRLKSRKEIKSLFKEGCKKTVGHLHTKFQAIHKSESDCHQVMISVPKSLFKRAVDRNQIKRRIREAYRLNKIILLREAPHTYFYIAFVYISREIANFQEIQQNMIQCLSKITEIDSDEKN